MKTFRLLYSQWQKEIEKELLSKSGFQDKKIMMAVAKDFPSDFIKSFKENTVRIDSMFFLMPNEKVITFYGNLPSAIRNIVTVLKQVMNMAYQVTF